jgi:hypothetical protein
MSPLSIKPFDLPFPGFFPFLKSSSPQKKKPEEGNSIQGVDFWSKESFNFV